LKIFLIVSIENSSFMAGGVNGKRLKEKSESVAAAWPHLRKPSQLQTSLIHHPVVEKIACDREHK